MSGVSGVTLRPARAGEAAALSALAFASKSHWPYTAAQLALWPDDLSLSEADVQDGTVSVAELPGQAAPAGWMRLLPAPPAMPDPWVLEHFWVAPAAMGQGVGKALLAQAVALARAGGASALSIDADPYAEAFYLAQGAQRVGVVAAPLEAQLERVRPQLLLALG